MRIDPKGYLEYLDKEMTIMGILSAVSIAAAAGVLNAVLSEQTGVRGLLWLTGRYFIILGSVLSALAALYFYKQRSLVAWYYGQISLSNALEEEPKASAELRELVRGADCWETWWPYSWGFTSLIAGFTAYLAAFFFCLIPPYWAFLSNHLFVAKITALSAIVGATVIVASLQHYVWTHDDYKFREEPWSDFWNTLKRSRSTFPHERVYARLAGSSISGVGVEAIRDIPKGVYIFDPDDEDLLSLKITKIDNALDPNDPLRRLYEDFCVLRDGIYECPISFNKLTPSWFLNHSETPNVAADSSLRFYALREIMAGEELTADYRTYAENVVSL